ncbi:bifunctional phosphopantothenoylcysteine decarboxylase/phosphopantothenate--cysteine ligase CoaBC [Thermincola ferriacetica]
MLQGKCVVLGVTGGIAAYKAADLASRLIKHGAEVHVIMTKAACRFITPLTLQTISRQRVITDMFQEPVSWEVQHIALADKADLMAVVPATANIIGKVANGIADDMLSTTLMATKAPVVFAPAMNVHMYENPIVQGNINKLKQLGYYFIEPATGRLACGYEGKGRLPDVEYIMDKLIYLLVGMKDFAGKKVLVTAGGTREAIDPVRFISNRSTGKMGYAIAEAARDRGAEVTLISGPTTLDAPRDVRKIEVESADEMFEAVKQEYLQADVVIKAAAVADYKPVAVTRQKIKKGPDSISLELTRNPDILEFLGQNKGDRILVGFAAETENLMENAQKKLKKKNLDLIVANDLTLEGAGFGVDTNVVKLLFADGRVIPLEKMPKRQVADIILDTILTLK